MLLAETGSAAEARRRRAPLVRQPSLDTVCTNVTSADEFVWVDSHNRSVLFLTYSIIYQWFNGHNFDYLIYFRLVELRCVPWTASEINRTIQIGRCKEIAPKMASDAPSRLAYLLQRYS